MLPRRLATVALVALPLLFASSCRGADPVKPKPFETPTNPTSSAPTPTSTPQAESAEDFIRHFIRAQNDMQSTGVTSAYRALTSGCDSCDAIADRVEGIYGAGGWVRTKGWTVTLVQAPVTLAPGSLRIDYVISSAPTKYKERANQSVRSLPGAEGIEKRTEIKRTATGWNVTYLAELAS
jgi:hypothetical protein